MTTFILPAAQPAQPTGHHTGGKSSRATAENGAQFGHALSGLLDADAQQQPVLELAEPLIDPDAGQSQQTDAGEWAPTTLGRDLIPEFTAPDDTETPAVPEPSAEGVADAAAPEEGQEPVVVVMPQAATATGSVAQAATAPAASPAPAVQQPATASPEQPATPAPQAVTAAAAPATTPQGAPTPAVPTSPAQATQPDTEPPVATTAQQSAGAASTSQPSVTPAAQPVDAAASAPTVAATPAPAAPQPVAPAAAAAAQPVAVPQQTPALAPQLTGPVYQLAQAGEGQHVMTVSVNPENIGPVTVRAHITATGVQIELFAPGDAGRDALRAIITDLRRDLASLMPQSTLNVSTSDSPPPATTGQSTSQGGGQAGWNSQHGGQPGAGRGTGTSEPAERYRDTAGEPTVTSETSTHQAGRLDVVA